MTREIPYLTKPNQALEMIIGQGRVTKFTGKRGSLMQNIAKNPSKSNQFSTKDDLFFMVITATNLFLLFICWCLYTGHVCLRRTRWLWCFLSRASTTYNIQVKKSAMRSRPFGPFLAHVTRTQSTALELELLHRSRPESHNFSYYQLTVTLLHSFWFFRKSRPHSCGKDSLENAKDSDFEG